MHKLNLLIFAIGSLLVACVALALVMGIAIVAFLLLRKISHHYHDPDPPKKEPVKIPDALLKDRSDGPMRDYHP